MDDNGEDKLTVYLLHSLPLRMSVVQVFVGDKMACVGHLVTEATIGREQDLGLEDTFANAKWRAMIIKDNQGDWALCAAAWKGMKPGQLFSSKRNSLEKMGSFPDRMILKSKL